MSGSLRSILLSPLAEHDLEDIWVYTFRTWSREQADRYHASLIDAITALASGARTGREASEVRQGYRRFSIGRHVLFYLMDDERITVIRILHQRMDIPARLGDDDDVRP